MAIPLGGDLRIRDHPDARCDYTGQQRKRLTNDVVTEGHRAQEEADDSLVEANHIDRGQTSQQGLEPELTHLLPRRAGLLLGVLGEPTDCERESEEPPDQVDGRPQRHEQDQAGRVQRVDDDHAYDVGSARQDPEEVERRESALPLDDRDAEAQSEDPGR